MRAKTNAAADAKATVMTTRDRRHDDAVQRLPPERRRVVAEEDVRVIREDPFLRQDDPGSATSWPFVLKPPRTAYSRGKRMASRNDEQDPVRREAVRLGRLMRTACGASAATADRVVLEETSPSRQPPYAVMAPSVSRRSTNRWYSKRDDEAEQEQDHSQRAAVAELVAAGSQP